MSDESNGTASINRELPERSIAVGGLFIDANRRILIVKPTCREEWLIPGGAVESGESPYDACMREIREELGLGLPIGRLLCLEYCSPSPFSNGDKLRFIFEGSTLLQAQIAGIILPVLELSAFRFAPEEEAYKMLVPQLANRVRHAVMALRHRRFIYLENGTESSGSDYYQEMSS